MNPKKSITKKTSFNKNMTGGKRKKSSKKKSSKKKGSKKKGSRKKKSSKKKGSRKQVVKRVVNRPVFYNTYDPVYDYLSAARLGSSFNNLTNISSAPTGNRDYLTQNYQDALTSTRDQAIISAEENMSNRTMYDNPMTGIPSYSSGIGADLSYDPSVEEGYQAIGINTRGQRLDAELEGQMRARQRAEQATTHSAELGAAVYGPAYLQPNFDQQNMYANPSLDNIFHQEELMMNGGGFDF
jgi:hypothetical protein